MAAEATAREAREAAAGVKRMVGSEQAGELARCQVLWWVYKSERVLSGRL